MDSKEGKVKIDMTECVKNVVDKFPIKFEEIWENMTPAGVDLFSRDTSEKLNEEMRTIFHQTVAQGSFVHKRA